MRHRVRPTRSEFRLRLYSIVNFAQAFRYIRRAATMGRVDGRLFGALAFIALGAISCAGTRATLITPAPSPAPHRSPTLTLVVPAASATHIPTPTRTATATFTPTVRPTPTPMRLVGYLAGWNVIGSRKTRIADLPADKLTHLNYAFANVSANGVCVSGSPAADSVAFPELQKLKQRYPHLKTLISLGGADGSKNFPVAARTAETRQRFAASCVQFMRDNGFDGIDVDWEFPANAAQKQNYVAMLAELRAQLDALGAAQRTRYLLTIAAPAGPDEYAGVAWERLARDLDWINLMTYDFAGSWSALTGFNAPLYASSNNPVSDPKARLYNAHAAVQAYLAAGVPSEKILLGVPFYGRGWKGVPEANRGLYQKHAGVPQGTYGGGAFDYRDLKANYLPTYTRYWDTQAQVPWLYNPATGILISYDDPESLALKAEYARNRKLGGVMIWEISADDEGHSLLNALYARLK